MNEQEDIKVESRMKKIFQILEASNLHAMVLIPSPTFTYLTGLQYHLDERPKVLIIGRGIEPIMVLPEFEAGMLAHSPLQVKAFLYGENQDLWGEVFKEACEYVNLAGKNVGIEPLHMRARELYLLQEGSPTTSFISASPALDALRMQKDEKEIDKMRKAAQIAQNAFKATLSVIKAGVTEKEIASELVMQLLQHGSDPSLGFLPIVASGPNGANPHAHPTNRHLSPGDLVVIDWGARYEGYCSDITRTLAIGGISPELEKYAQIVADANKAGRHAAKSGVTAAQVDKAARDVIENADYGQYFIHRTGHGLGMEVHEPPYITNANQAVLKNGMTFTVEPGIYISGYMGIRIEDDVVVRDQGGESLTDLPRELIKIY
jgi:Xaa-Pro dipeptidase